MKEHLTDREIADLLAGATTAEAICHLDQCPSCRAEVARDREAMASFRGAMRGWSEQSMPSPPSIATAAPDPKPRRVLAAPRWALAALLLVAVGVPLWRGLTPKPRPVPVSDSAALLDQVNAELSRSVPAPMEPLLGLSPEAAEEAKP